MDGKLTIYVPEDPRQRRVCYRSQLPRLLANLTGCDAAAVDDISNIVSCQANELNDVILERDITDVTWIAQPTLDLIELQENEQPQIQNDVRQDSPDDIARLERNDSADTSDARSAPRASSVLPVAVVEQLRGARGATRLTTYSSISQQEQYRKLLDQLFHSARGMANQLVCTFDSSATFGIKETNEFIYNRRIGAAGEAFVSFPTTLRCDTEIHTHDQFRSSKSSPLSTFPSSQLQIGRALFGEKLLSIRATQT